MIRGGLGQRSGGWRGPVVTSRLVEQPSVRATDLSGGISGGRAKGTQVGLLAAGALLAAGVPHVLVSRTVIGR